MVPSIDIVVKQAVLDDLDLDTILSELLELENQLSGDAADQLLVGITSPLSQPSASSSSNQIGAQTSGAANKINSNEACFLSKCQSIFYAQHDALDCRCCC